MNTLKLILAVLAVCFVVHGSAAQGTHEAHEKHDAHGSHGEHGVVDFPISCNPGAQEAFNRGMALLHHMMYEQAEEVFDAAAEADADCAMAYWGIAMTQLHPLWAPPTPQEVQKGQAAVAQARTLTAPTAREQAYIEAVGAFFEGDTTPFPARLSAWEAGMQAVFQSNPDDVEAETFYALSLLATADKSDRTFSQQARAGEMLEGLHARLPTHPGLFHYLIHAYDNPVLAERGLDVARGYDKLAPSVPHALHMPSHIFVRLGMWPDVISWNKRSAEAALAQPVQGMVSMHYSHASDYLVYAYLQQGQDDAAKEVIAELVEKGPMQEHMGTAYGIAAARSRYVLERRAWKEAAEMPARIPADFAWDNFPSAEAIVHFARGLGAARSGDLATAREAADQLNALHAKVVEANDIYWATQVDAQRKSVGAWILLEEGDTAGALALMRDAADTEDSVDKHPVTPSAVRPARELLGDMLVIAGQPEEAIDAYEESLATSPGRLNSLYGAGLAAQAIGSLELADGYFERIVELVSPTTPTVTSIEDARSALATMRP